MNVGLYVDSYRCCTLRELEEMLPLVRLMARDESNPSALSACDRQAAIELLLKNPHKLTRPLARGRYNQAAALNVMSSSKKSWRQSVSENLAGNPYIDRPRFRHGEVEEQRAA